MKRHGHSCNVCGEYRANEKFTGKGHAAHICKSCAALPPAQQAEQIALTRLAHLPAYLSKADFIWLKNRLKDHRPAVRQAPRKSMTRVLKNKNSCRKNSLRLRRLFFVRNQRKWRNLS